jgi:hypothetical protein
MDADTFMQKFANTCAGLRQKEILEFQNMQKIRCDEFEKFRAEFHALKSRQLLETKELLDNQKLKHELELKVISDNWLTEYQETSWSQKDVTDISTAQKNVEQKVDIDNITLNTLQENDNSSSKKRKGDEDIFRDVTKQAKHNEICTKNQAIIDDDETDDDPEVLLLLSKQANFLDIPVNNNSKIRVCPQWFDGNSRPVSIRAKRYYLQCKEQDMRNLDSFAAILKSSKNPFSTAPHYFDAMLKLLNEYGLQRCLETNVKELLTGRKDLSNFRGALFAFRRFYSKIK